MYVLTKEGRLRRVAQNVPLDALSNLKTLLDQLASVDWSALTSLGAALEELSTINWSTYSAQLDQILSSLSSPQTQVELEQGGPPQPPQTPFTSP